MTKEAVEGQDVSVGDLRIHYHDIGTGPDVVICLHGGGPGASAWSNFKGNIDALSEYHRLILVDMPQYGRSSKVAITGTTFTEFVAPVIAGLMDHVGLERAHFVGNSLGGQIAIKMAIEYPERVRRVVVIGSTPVAQSVMVPWPAEGVRVINEYYRGDGPTIDKMRFLLGSLMFDSSRLDPATVRVF